MRYVISVWGEIFLSHLYEYKKERFKQAKMCNERVIFFIKVFQAVGKG